MDVQLQAAFLSSTNIRSPNKLHCPSFNYQWLDLSVFVSPFQSAALNASVGIVPEYVPTSIIGFGWESVAEAFETSPSLIS